MNNNRPICPHCIVEITYDDITDESLNISAYEVGWRGTCPICGAHFTWTEIYHYSRMESFEEEVDNG